MPISRADGTLDPAWFPASNTQVLESTGDLIIGSDASNTNYATVANGASVYEASRQTNGVNLLDSSNSTAVWTAIPVAGKTITVDLGQARYIRQAELDHDPSGGTTRYATELLVESSSDLSTWTTRGVTTVASGTLNLVVTFSLATARYWRFRAVTGGSQGWKVGTVRLYGSAVAQAIRLPIGAEATVLTTQSGYPVWKAPAPIIGQVLAWSGSAWAPATSSGGGGGGNGGQYVQATAPASPAVGDLWLDTGVTPAAARIWNGSAWYGIGIVPRSFGWYFDADLTVGDAIGPIYELDATVAILGFEANVKVPPTATAATLDVQFSTDLNTWTSLFSTKPTIAIGTKPSIAGTLTTTQLAPEIFPVDLVASGIAVVREPHDANTRFPLQRPQRSIAGCRASQSVHSGS